MIARLWANKDGHIAIEYGMIAALVAILLIASMTGIGLEVETMFGDLVDPLAAPKP